MSDVVLLRRRRVVQATVALQIHCDSRFRGRRFEVFCLECVRKRLALTTADLQEIGRNDSGATAPC